MGNAYGFMPPPQMQAQPQQVGAAMLGGPPSFGGATPGMPELRAPPDPDSEMRREGARLMTTAQTTDGDSALLSAIGEALTRGGSGFAGNPSPFKDRERARRDLQRLGLSEAEAELMQMLGGA
jgi:hypothetical protein